MEANAAKEMNRIIRRLAAMLPGGDSCRYAFVCECGCGETVHLTAAEFDATDRVLAEGHKPDD